MTRIFDILFSLFAILVLLPFLLPIMIVLKFTGEHDIFYLQPRVGKGGKIFNVMKFATMLKNSSSMSGGFITQQNDPRILPMGNFLRKTKINELPQLINIFLGEMSFVGPRPIVKQHIDLYSDEVRSAISGLRPGLTGIGSLIFRDEEDILNKLGGDRKYFHDCVIAPYKGELEIWYSNNKSLFVYFAAIFLTAVAVIKPNVRWYFSIFPTLPQPKGMLKNIV